MKLIALMPVRNEEWCLGLSLRVALMWCDAVVVGLHACTDRSADIVLEVKRENPGRVHWITLDDPKWDEMAHRQMLLEIARGQQATHISIVDADEVLTGNLLETGALHACAEDGEIIRMPGYNLRGSLSRYHANGIWGRRFFSLAFLNVPALSWTGDTFHHREPRGVRLEPYGEVKHGRGGIMHLWGVSERRLRAKHALYKITERLRWPDKPVADIDRMYSWAIHGDPRNAAYGTPETWTYADVPASWWSPYAHLMHHLHVDAEPWQEAECRRLIAEHGRGQFAGLDLFGVA